MSRRTLRCLAGRACGPDRRWLQRHGQWVNTVMLELSLVLGLRVLLGLELKLGLVRLREGLGRK